jgi:ADP-glucose pyrophosphorylase
MDLISIHPIFNLYNYDWPIYTDYGPYRRRSSSTATTVASVRP